MKKKISNTKRIRKRYDRLAFFYDFLEAPFEWLRFSLWRSKLTKSIVGQRALEVGVGTGKNLTYYPKEVFFSAIDISPRMLKRAQKKARLLGLNVEFTEMDAQHLAYPEKTFDTIFATFVFCSVPDAILGLQELRRVCRQGGKLLLLEHVRPSNPILGIFFDLVNPVVVRIMGANINRKTIDNIREAGWKILINEKLSSGIVRWIEAEP